jgi:hypothetical protein
MLSYGKQTKGLHLKIPLSDTELSFIANLYASQNPIGMIPVDLQKSIIELRKAIQEGSYLRLIMVDNTIHGFIKGNQVNIPHSSEKTVQQLYYYCDLKGLAAFRAVVLAHEGLIKYAEGLKAKYVLSPCSQFYKNDNLCRILVTQGWEQFGYMALWRTCHNSNPSSSVLRA